MVVAMIDDDAIVEVVQHAFPDAAVVYRFGSTVRGESSGQSDVDVAFLPSAPVDPVLRFRVQEQLAARLRRDVDLVDLARASTVMQMQVVSGGVAVATADDRRRGAFEDLVFVRYARLNEERRGILQDVQERGSVYGG